MLKYNYASLTVFFRYLYENKDSFNGYAGKFLLCEFANLVNVLVQIYFMDVFLGENVIL